MVATMNITVIIPASRAREGSASVPGLAGEAEWPPRRRVMRRGPRRRRGDAPARQPSPTFQNAGIGIGAKPASSPSWR
jgi:hypothetical protein